MLSYQRTKPENSKEPLSYTKQKALSSPRTRKGLNNCSWYHLASIIAPAGTRILNTRVNGRFRDRFRSNRLPGDLRCSHSREDSQPPFFPLCRPETPTPPAHCRICSFVLGIV